MFACSAKRGRLIRAALKRAGGPPNARAQPPPSRERYRASTCLFAGTATRQTTWRRSKFTSPLWIGGEILLGFSLTILVGTLIAAFGDQIKAGRSKPSAYAASPRRLPNIGTFDLPVAPELRRSPRIVGPGLLTFGQTDAAGASLTLGGRIARQKTSHGDVSRWPVGDTIGEFSLRD
jgi:hypothetical protein